MRPASRVTGRASRFPKSWRRKTRMAKRKTPRWGWALTGSGHFLKETLALVRELDEVALFLSKAAAEVLHMYKQELDLPRTVHVFQDRKSTRLNSSHQKISY